MVVLLLGFLWRKIKYLNNFRQTNRERESLEENDVQSSGEFGVSLEENLSTLEGLLGNSSDVKKHHFRFGTDNKYMGALVFIDGLVNGSTLTDTILRPLTEWIPEENESFSSALITDVIAEQVLCSGDLKSVSKLSEMASGCLAGDTALLIEGCASGLVVTTKGWEKRAISEPQSETVVRGPREGFTENLRTNTALIRRKIKSGDLRTENMIVGHQTKTDICLMYLMGVADEKVIKRLKQRIGSLDVDSILESGYIEEYIEDAPFSPFATVGYTEKPDVAAAKMLEGRVVVVVDGTPFVLTAPMLFIESFQTTEDYYTRPLYASIIRILRFIGFFFTVFAPAIYIALTAFHQELIPTTLLLTIAGAREGTPFPVFLECFIMLFAFEILREAGIRLPRPVGQAISIVGALIMGEASVSAGLVGAPVVIVIAITAVAGFLVPAQNDSASILRVCMMILAAFAGWYGISMGVLALLMHLGSLYSFGVSYFDGFSWSSNLQDSVVRMPLWSMVRRPKGIASGNTIRRKFFIPPLRPHAHEDEEETDI